MVARTVRNREVGGSSPPSPTNTISQYLYERVTTTSADPALAAVLNHVRTNTVPTDSTRVICVDGGYRPEQNRGALARPGGHLGLSQAVLKIKHDHPEFDFTAEKAFDLVHAFAVRSGQTYGWHSDQQADPPEDLNLTHSPERPILGCGHCARATIRPDIYGLQAEDARALIAYARQYHTQHPTDLVILNREHQEKAVLVITGTQKTVNSWDVAGTGNQYFIYDATRDQSLIENLVTYLNQQGYPQLTLEMLQTAVQTQTNATLGLLAGGLSIYTVNADGVEPKVVAGQIIGKTN